MKQNTESNELKCPKCNQVLSDEYKFDRHIRFAHSPAVEVFYKVVSESLRKIKI